MCDSLQQNTIGYIDLLNNDSVCIEDSSGMSLISSNSILSQVVETNEHIFIDEHDDSELSTALNNKIYSMLIVSQM